MTAAARRRESAGVASVRHAVRGRVSLDRVRAEQRKLEDTLGRRLVWVMSWFDGTHTSLHFRVLDRD